MIYHYSNDIIYPFCLNDQLAAKHYTFFYAKLHSHTNPLISQILSNTQTFNPTNRLKKIL